MRNVKRSLAILFTFIFTLAIILFASYSFYFVKQRWIINGVNFKNTPKYMDITSIEPIISDYIGKSFIFTDLHDLHRMLLQNDWLKDVEISRVWPDAIEVSFQEVVPLAIINGHGVITTEGKIIATNVIPRGSHPLFDVESEYIEDAFVYYFDILSKVSVVGLRIDKLSHDAVDGWKVILDKGFELVIGHDDVPARVTRFVLAYQRKLENMAENFLYVDLRYTNGVAIGWKTTNN